MAAMMSSEQNFQNLRKSPVQNFNKTFQSKFHRNRPDSVDKKGCDRHMHRETNRQGTLRVDLFNPEMTEYKK